MRQPFPFFSLIVLLSFIGFNAQVVSAQDRTLQIGSPIPAPFGAEVSHFYQIPVKTGEFIRLVAFQKNADVELAVFSPDGQLLIRTDNSNTPEEIEKISFIAAGVGIYRIEVRQIERLPKTDGPDYEIILETQRAPTDSDEIRIKAEALYSEANLLRFKRDKISKEGSINIFSNAARLFVDAGDQTGAALAFYAIGQVQGQLGRFDDAQVNYEKAAGKFRENGDRALLAVVLENSAPVYFRLFNLPKTIEVLTEAQKLYENLNNRRGGVSIASKFGLVYQTLGQTEKAIATYRDTLPLLEELGDLSQAATTLSNLASLYDETGDPQNAIATYERALDVRRRLNDGQSIANTLTNLATIYRRTGEAEKFLSANNEALALFRERGNQAGEATCLNNLAGWYYSIAELEKAEELHRASLAIWTKLGNSRMANTSLANLGDIFFVRKNWNQALDFYTKAMTGVSDQSDPASVSRIQTKLGTLFLAQRNAPKAAEFLNQALQGAISAGDLENEAETRMLLSQVLIKTNPGNEALEMLEKALAIHSKLKDRSGEATALVLLSKLQAERGNLAMAQILAEKALANVESGRGAILRPDLRASFFAGNQLTYENYLEILMRRHRTEPDKGFDALALEISERARARNLLESLGELDLKLDSPSSRELAAREKLLLRTINEKEFRRTRLVLEKSTPESISLIERELGQLVDELRQVQAELRRSDAHLAGLKAPKILTLAEMRTEVLDDDTVLLEYFLGETQGWLFVVTNRGLEVIALPGRGDVEKLAKPFIAAIRENPQRNAAETEGDFKRRLEQTKTVIRSKQAELSRLLIMPVGAAIKGKRLLIVASDILQYVPFAVLQNQSENKYLIETNEIINLASASVLAVVRNTLRPNPTSDLAVIADPVFDPGDSRVRAALTRTTGQAPELPAKLPAGLKRLEFSRFEAEAIGKLFADDRRTVALDFTANRQLTNSKSFTGARFVHLASHGWVNSATPELSGIVLSLVTEHGEPQDGFLRLSDIYNLRLSAELVVLSACETGLGEEIRGEGIIGLTRGFMYAGSPRVVSSLWSVDDRATYQLMRRFYENMLRGGLSVPAALRKAQVSLLQEKAYDSPFYWAPFIVQGEFK